MLDYKLLEAFAMVIIEGGFEKASRKLHLTQSAVSQRVKQLEDQYGQILLKRTAPPEPTERGIPLLVHYRQVRQLEIDLHHGCESKEQSPFTSLAIGVNADSLAFWFFSAVQEVLQDEKIVLDLHVDDQDQTHQFMQEGKVWGCISTRSQPLQGCKATHLGRLKYGIFSTREFAGRWFPDGLIAEAFKLAPMARFNRKDDLNSRMFSLLLAHQPQNPPTFYLPSTEAYGLFVSESRCYGLLPEQQSRPLEASGKIINLSPEHSVDVELHWHSWNLKSALMERFNRHFISRSKQLLDQATI
ncbi:MAG: LysR family transcriptional regulator ArgP [Pseudomonadota bacterium]